MKEQLINCPRCNSNACSEMSDGNITIWQCLGCGFTSNTFLNEENSVKYKEVLPELYKDLEFIDEKGLRWYPTSVAMEERDTAAATREKGQGEPAVLRRMTKDASKKLEAAITGTGKRPSGLIHIIKKL